MSAFRKLNHVFKIQHLGLSVLAFIFIIAFTSLGFWQLSRAEQKQHLLDNFTARNKTVLTINDLQQKTFTKQDLRFYQLTLSGHWDDHTTFLLDNKTSQGKVGYEVYSLFKADGFPQPFLIDRGFMPLTLPRQTLPMIQATTAKVHLTGMLNEPPKYFALGKMVDKIAPQLNTYRIEYVNIHELNQLTHRKLFPYVVTLVANHPAAFAIQWQIVTMPPEKHQAYAFQWFAFALTLLLLFVVLNYRAGRNS